jgi:hypothetical protein
MLSGLLSISFLCVLLQAAPCTARGVSWYVAASNVEGNAAFLRAHSGSITGAYLCCSFVSFTANGSFTQRFSDADSTQQIHVFTDAAAETWSVGDVAEVAIKSGSWIRGMDDARAWSQTMLKAGLSGIIMDYEPADNYTAEHAAAYGAFLQALSTAVAPLRVGMDIADWGILGPKFWQFYASNTGVSRFTSMTPTYDAKNITLDEEFVAQALAFFPPGSFAAGVGTVLQLGQKCGGGDYLWSNATFPPFVSNLATQGLEFIDVWRCDIDSPYDNKGSADLTAPWFLDSLGAFLE